MIKTASLIIILAAVAPVFAIQTCRKSTTDEFHALPGYAHYAKSVQADFGGRAPKTVDVNGGQTDNNVVRPDGNTDRTGMLCMGGGPFEATAAAPGDLVCNTRQAQYSGRFDGANGTLIATLTAGYTGEAQWSTTKSTTVGVGITGSVTAGVKNVYSVEREVTTTFDLTNTQSASTTSSISQSSTFTVTAIVPEGHTCQMFVNVTSCTLNTGIKVPITFSGYVHNNFDRDVTYSGQGRDNKHQDWWINPAIYGLDPNTELSSIMEVDGSLQSTSYGQAYVKCTDTAGGESTVNVDPTHNNVTVPASPAAPKRRLLV